MHFPSWSRALILPAVLAAAGCRDVATAPRAPSARFVTIGEAGPVTWDGTSYEFVVTPAGGRFVLGPTAVSFPAGSICDPLTSGYGPTTWDAPCTPLTTPVAIHAVIRQAGDSSTVDFSPALRFVPATAPDGYVTITMTLPHVAGDAPTPSVAIDWLPVVGGARVSERASDPTLVPILLTGGAATRRIKHFSGYIISTG
ncbi:MAG: hypothetical protein NVS1B4_23360 [Gemmatimonadaceae bacterium]